MENYITKDFDYLRQQLLYRKIVKWNGNEITLDNGTVLKIEETEQDCCASANGSFENVVLDAAITSVSNIKYSHWEDEGEDGSYGCFAVVTIMHNRNVICQAVADADAGNGGYYYSIASFLVYPVEENPYIVHFVSSDDE